MMMITYPWQPWQGALCTLSYVSSASHTFNSQLNNKRLAYRQNRPYVYGYRSLELDRNCTSFMDYSFSLRLFLPPLLASLNSHTILGVHSEAMSR
jgi:hypothetical protein